MGDGAALDARSVDIDRLIDAVTDGTDVDWPAAAARLAAADDRQLVPQLSAVADLIRFFRSMADDESTTTRRETPPADIDVTSWGQFEIRARIGSGTYGTVFRARQPGLDRDVALKLLRDGHAVDRKAVIDEARLLARVQHTNVVTIYGADCFDGRVGLWTEFILGRTLKQILDAQGPFSAQEATIVGLDMCRALAAVHQAGFLHRDVKAQNVMRAHGGRIVLMDFGAAALMNVAGAVQARLQGTPFYLAPEVLEGGAATVQSDLYSLGVMLYHLVSGEFLVTGSSIDELRQAHARGQRRWLRDVRADLPAAFVRIVDEATAFHPEQRPDSAGALEALLENAAGRSSIARIGAPLAAGDRQARRARGIAVLPFFDMSPERNLEYFCSGIAEEMINALTRVPGLRVVARSSAFKFGSRVDDVRQVGSLLDVGTVLEGSVQRSDNRLRVIARVVDTADGEQLWSQRFDRELDDLFAVEEEIANAAVGALGVGVSHERRPHGRLVHLQGTHDLRAYTSFLKGRHYWNQRTEVSLRKSAEHFLEALAQEPGYAQAYAGLAQAYATLGLYGALSPLEVMPQAKAAAQRAIEIAETLSTAHATAACVAAVYDWSWRRADAQFRRAIELNPDDPDVRHWYAINYLVPLKRFDEASRELRRAAAADPFSVPIHISRGIRSYFARQFDDAHRELSDSLRFEPGSVTGRLFLGLTLVESGRCEEAVRELETAIRLSDSPEMTAALGYAFAQAGDGDAARRTLETLRRMASHRYVSASLLAQVHAGLDEKLTALEWLEKARDARATDLAWLGVRPVFDRLRAEPRFAALIAAIGHD